MMYWNSISTIRDKGQPVVTAEEAMNWFKAQLEELESR